MVSRHSTGLPRSRRLQSGGGTLGPTDHRSVSVLTRAQSYQCRKEAICREWSPLTRSGALRPTDQSPDLTRTGTLRPTDQSPVRDIETHRSVPCPNPVRDTDTHRSVPCPDPDTDTETHRSIPCPDLVRDTETHRSVPCPDPVRDTETYVQISSLSRLGRDTEADRSVL